MGVSGLKALGFTGLGRGFGVQGLEIRDERHGWSSGPRNAGSIRDSGVMMTGYEVLRQPMLDPN